MFRVLGFGGLEFKIEAFGIRSAVPGVASCRDHHDHGDDADTAGAHEDDDDDGGGDDDGARGGAFGGGVLVIATVLCSIAMYVVRMYVAFIGIIGAVLISSCCPNS